MKLSKFGREFKNHVFDQIRIRLYGFTFEERIKYRLLQEKLAKKEVPAAELKKLQAELSGLAKLRRERIQGQSRVIWNSPPGHGADMRYSYREGPAVEIGKVPSIKDAAGGGAFWDRWEKVGPPYPLHFDGSYSSLSGIRSITEVKEGLIGWSAQAGDLIQRTVTGMGKDNSACVSLGLEWSGTIPEKGMWALRRSGGGSYPLFMSGRHRVIASGCFLSDYDASVSVFGGMVVRVATADHFWSASFGPIRSSDSTRSEDREKYFVEELGLPSEVIIDAPGEAYVGVTLFVNADLWADPDDNNSLAFAEIGTFGIPANAIYEAGNLWKIDP